MYRKILVAVDGSSTSEEALVSAARLARALSARLRIMHVTDSPYDYPDVMYGHVPGDVEELREAWHKAGQEVIDRAVVAALREGCAAEPRLVEGSGSVHVSEHVAAESSACSWAAWPRAWPAWPVCPCCWCGRRTHLPEGLGPSCK